MATTTRLTSESRGKLWILMITAFIDMAGLLMVIPLLPFYAKSLGAGGLVVGMLVSSFSVAQLISASPTPTGDAPRSSSA
jgi:MFS family permease